MAEPIFKSINYARQEDLAFVAAELQDTVDRLAIAERALASIIIDVDGLMAYLNEPTDEPVETAEADVELDVVYVETPAEEAARLRAEAAAAFESQNAQ